MNDDRSFERLVADNLAGMGGMPMNDEFYDDIDAYASRHRQPRRWLALIKESPMRTNSKLAVGSPTARVAAIMAATLLLAVALAAAGVAGQRLLAADGPIVVDQSGAGDFTTISDAVAAATDGDVILVKPGTYPESVVIDKDISLLGEDRDSVIIEFGMGCSIDEASDFDEVSCPDGTPMLTREITGWPAFQQPFGIHLDGTTAEIGSLSIHDHQQVYSWGIYAEGGAPVIHDVKLTTTAEDGFGGHAVFLDGSAATCATRSSAESMPTT